MKFWKKVTAVFVVLLLVLSTMSIGVSATGETGSIGITIRADKSANLYPGDIVTFTINISTDFRYTAMRWPVMYTLKAFEPVIANDGNGDTDYCNVIGYGPLAGSESYLESGEPTGTDPFGGTYTKANYGCLLIQWTAGTTGNGMSNYYEPNGADCLTFQLRVKSGYTSNKGVGTIAIPTTNQAKNMFYLQGITDPADPDTLFKLTTTTCTITSTPCTVTIIKDNPGLIPSPGSDTVIDEQYTDDNGIRHNYIYGLTPIVRDYEQIDETNIDQYVATTGNATYTLIPNDNGLISTGAKLRLYDASGTFLDEYTFIVFGDCDGNCIFDGADLTLVIKGFLYEETWSYYDLRDNALFFSCDVNHDGIVFLDDYGPLAEAVGQMGYIDQTYNEETCFIYY